MMNNSTKKHVELNNNNNNNNNNNMEYNPNKNYKWTPKDEFKFSGEEFGRILHSFRTILSTQEAQNILLINEANKVMESKLKEYVEKGVIKEQEEPKQEVPEGAKMNIVRK